MTTIWKELTTREKKFNEKHPEKAVDKSVAFIIDEEEFPEEAKI